MDTTVNETENSNDKFIRPMVESLDRGRRMCLTLRSYALLESGQPQTRPQ